MEKETYLKRKSDLEGAYKRKVLQLSKDYAASNNPYKAGDIVTDHIGPIKIESMGYAWDSLKGMPTCTYIGLELKKDGTPKKRGIIRKAYQINLLKSK